MNKKKKRDLSHWYLFKNTDGKKSLSYTMLVIAFSAITLWFILSMTEEISGLKIRPFSGSEAMLYFSPIATLYFSRKHQTKDQANGEGGEDGDVDTADAGNAANDQGNA